MVCSIQSVDLQIGRAAQYVQFFGHCDVARQKHIGSSMAYAQHA